MRPLRPLLALSVVALVGACGTGSGTSGSGAPGSTAAPPSSTASSTTTGPTGTATGTTTQPDPENPTVPPSGRGKLVTVTGTVSAGVENGCLLLTTQPASPDGPWQLVGNIAGIAAGQKITVRGARVDMVATTCQQGMPFDVQTVVKS